MNLDRNWIDVAHRFDNPCVKLVYEYGDVVRIESCSNLYANFVVREKFLHKNQAYGNNARCSSAFTFHSFKSSFLISVSERNYLHRWIFRQILLHYSASLAKNFYLLSGGNFNWNTVLRALPFINRSGSKTRTMRVFRRANEWMACDACHQYLVKFPSRLDVLCIQSINKRLNSSEFVCSIQLKAYRFNLMRMFIDPDKIKSVLYFKWNKMKIDGFVSYTTPSN